MLHKPSSLNIRGPWALIRRRWLTSFVCLSVCIFTTYLSNIIPQIQVFQFISSIKLLVCDYLDHPVVLSGDDSVPEKGPPAKGLLQMRKQQRISDDEDSSHNQSLAAACVNSKYLSVKHFLWSSVLWRCWLGGSKGIRPVKNWVVGCWHGYLSGARCRLAYGPADATATHCLLL